MRVGRRIRWGGGGERAWCALPDFVYVAFCSGSFQLGGGGAGGSQLGLFEEMLTEAGRGLPACDCDLGCSPLTLEPFGADARGAVACGIEVIGHSRVMSLDVGS